MRDNHSPKASLENLLKIFTVPESAESTLAQLDREISQNVSGFLQDRIVAVEKELSEVEKDFSTSAIPELPTFVSDHTDFVLNKLVAHSVHTASPAFVGHMTTALPYFMLPLSKIMIALNQNLVKIETSKAFTPLERQVLGMMHRIVYQQNDAFYDEWMHKSSRFLGSFCSGGTLANITALWVARNNAFPPTDDFDGIHQEGWHNTLQHYGYNDAAILVSELGHYSLSKSADILGIGRKNIISIPTTPDNKVDTIAMERTCRELQAKNTKIIAIVGIAGTTETGNIDPLSELATLAKTYKCHYHVDAAWGGPTLFSKQHNHLLTGIEQADSVTVDAHKQMYIPMGAAMVLFKEPTTARSLEHHAEYIVREGSKDLGVSTLEGSRPGMALLVHAGLHIIGRQGYELLIQEGIRKARYFAELIKQQDDFELISEPELNILTYRYVPPIAKTLLQSENPNLVKQCNHILDKLTKTIQKAQREHGKAFVSRTRLLSPRYQRQPIGVFRVVLANPLTTEETLQDVLAEQRVLAKEYDEQHFIELVENTRSDNSPVILSKTG